MYDMLLRILRDLHVWAMNLSKYLGIVAIILALVVDHLLEIVSEYASSQAPVKA